MCLEDSKQKLVDCPAELHLGDSQGGGSSAYTEMDHVLTSFLLSRRPHCLFFMMGYADPVGFCKEGPAVGIPPWTPPDHLPLFPEWLQTLPSKVKVKVRWSLSDVGPTSLSGSRPKCQRQ